MFFNSNPRKNSKPANTSPTSLFEYFDENNKDQIFDLASKISPDAAHFFETSVKSMNGQLPGEMVDVEMTMSKESLNQLLVSAMMTGYIAKSVEQKIELERVWNANNEARKQESLTDKLLSKYSSKKQSIDDVI